MSKKIIITSLALVAISGFAFTGIAEAHKETKGGGGAHHHMEMPKLTADQQASLEKLMEEHIQQTNPLKTQFAIKSAEYKAIMKGTDPDPKAAGVAAGELSVVRQELDAKRMELRKTLKDDYGIERPFHKSEGLDRREGHPGGHPGGGRHDEDRRGERPERPERAGK